VLPKMSELATNGCYLKRLTCIQLVGHFIDLKINIQPVLSMIINMGKDDVPNVRFNCAQVYGKMKTLMNNGSINTADQTSIRQALSAMMQDSDSDVSFFSKEAGSTLGY
jgi:hypothetical protein